MDAVDAEDAACEVCERGMRFKAPWRFEIGAVLHIAFAIQDGTPCRVEAEGLVVDCVPGREREYQTTLLFVETSQELRASLGKVSHQLGSRRPARAMRSVRR